MANPIVLQQVPIPGPCPPEGCPPPTEIVCIKVAKVFDSCAQSDTVTITTTATTVDAVSLIGTTFACTVTPGTATVGSTAPDATGCVNVLVTIPFTVSFTASTTTIVILPVTGLCTSLATLYAPTGTTLQVDFTLTCSPPVPTITPIVGTTLALLTLTTVVACCVIITSEATVQLLVPSYGFCEIPPCGPLGLICPPIPPAQVNPSPCR